jgi:hypothetical protein
MVYNTQNYWVLDFVQRLVFMSDAGQSPKT